MKHKKDKIRIITCEYKCVPFMLCPKCNGEGKTLNNILNGHGLGYDIKMVECNLCNGSMVIPMAVIPEKK